GTAMQYSEDGVNWQPLGKAKEGSNWYNDTLYNIWSKQDATNWQMAAIPLPKGIPTIRLRYIFSSDIGSELEGLAIDDVEIVDDIPVVVDDNLVNVSPNPTRDGKITVEWTTKGGSDLQIAIFDAMGKQVYQSKTKGMAGINNTTLQTPRFSSGVYIMRVIVGDKKFSRKIVYL
ncbi:MAG TPA: T9SS type A sorting domain-containing protein, partial [Flavipsychrobacter sp.]